MREKLAVSLKVSLHEYIYYKYLLYKIERFVDFPAIIKIDKLTCVIIHDNLTCVIIVKRIRVYCFIFVGQ